MKKTLRYLRPLASIASFALFVYVLERSGPEAVLDKIRRLTIQQAITREARKQIASSPPIQRNA